MNWHKILYKCKACGRDGVANASIDCPPEWIDKLHPMLTCDSCYDVIQKERKSVDAIFRACASLLVSSFDRDAQRAERNSKCTREALMRATRIFADCVAFRRKRDTVWSMEFVEQFERTPDKAGQVLQMYRKLLSDMDRTGRVYTPE